MSDEPRRPITNDREAWKVYWARVQPPEWFERWVYWRTEPEIDEARQRFLSERRAVTADITKGIYPFRDEHGSIKLSRADVEWLLAMHNSGHGPIDWTDSRPHRLWGPDIRGADLRGVNLSELPLTQMQAGLTRAGWWSATRTQREMAQTHLEGSRLVEAHLQRAALRGAQLSGADLRGARLDRATLQSASLAGAIVRWAHLEGANLEDANLDGVDLRLAFFNPGTNLHKATLGSPLLAGMHWGGWDLSSVDWSKTRRLGDEVQARHRKDNKGQPKSGETRLGEFEAAVRANRQLATALRGQGLNEHADRYAYRAQVLQRQVLRRRGQWARAFGSWLLDVVAGYGHKPVRSVFTYVLVIALFAAAYFSLGGSHGQALSWNEAMVVSMTAFHGRGFFGSAFQPGDPQAAVAAVEALIGLLIEITFIATFTNRFFAR